MKWQLRSSQLILGLSLLVVALLTGCASSGKYTMYQPVSTKLSQYKNVTIQVESAVQPEPEHMDEYLKQLGDSIAVKLRDRKLFAQINSTSDTNADAALRIHVFITKVHDVDVGRRISWGVMAGSAVTEANVKLVEEPVDKVIGTGEVTGQSSNGTIFSGTTPQAVEQMADAVVKLVQSNM
jgi:hypothetical protein